MPGDYRILLSLVLGGAVVVYCIFLFPALTSGDAGGSAEVSQAEFDAVVSQEMAFCLGQSSDMNCQCFAKMSGTIQVHDEPRVFGAVYADKQELARGQAEHSC